MEKQYLNYLKGQSQSLKNNIEELFQLGAASIHPHKTFKEYVNSH